MMSRKAMLQGRLSACFMGDLAGQGPRRARWTVECLVGVLFGQVVGSVLCWSDDQSLGRGVTSLQHMR